MIDLVIPPAARALMAGAGTVLLAWLLDARFGEPRSAWHPVAWFGRAMAFVGRGLLRLGRRSTYAAGVAGAVAWCAAVAAVAALAWAVQA